MEQVVQSPLFESAVDEELQHLLLCKIEAESIKKHARFLANCAYEARYEKAHGVLPSSPRQRASASSKKRGAA